jgi:hypothetical protein
LFSQSENYWEIQLPKSRSFRIFHVFFFQTFRFWKTPMVFPSNRAQWWPHLQAPAVAGRLPQLPQHSSPEELQVRRFGPGRVGWEFSHYR